MPRVSGGYDISAKSILFPFHPCRNQLRGGLFVGGDGETGLLRAGVKYGRCPAFHPWKFPAILLKIFYKQLKKYSKDC